MNPPAAIQNAMARERKPFTYTPGGLDLSEIKSERMARRLMRNAMSEGVPEVTSPSVQSPTTPAPAFPQAAHYMNLPVQVFPAFQLPANPKSLLRTRSQPRENSIDRIHPTRDQYGYASPINGSEARESPVTELPPLPRKNNTEMSAANADLYFPPRVSTSPAPAPRVTPQVAPPITAAQTPLLSEDRWFDCSEDRLTPNIVLEPCLKMPSEILQSNTEDKKVKSKKKTSAKENAVDENVEVEATIKVTKPKKTISTAIDIQRRFLPDGKVEETKTTTTTTTINGKVEDTKVQKESRILSDEEAKLVIQEESDEEEEEVEEQEEVKESSKKGTVQENGTSKKVVTETKSETKKSVVTTEKREETKKPAQVTEVKEVKQIVTKQAPTSEDEEEEEEEDAVEPEKEEVIVAKPKQPEPVKQEVKQVKKEDSEEEEDEEEEEEVVEEKKIEEKVVEETKTATKIEQVNGTQESEEEEEEEEEEEIVAKKIEAKETEPDPEPEESEPEAEEPEPVKKTETKEVVEESEEEEEEEKVEESKTEPKEQPKDREVEMVAPEKEEVQVKTETSETKTESITSAAIPEVRTTTKTETTEITSSVSDDTSGRPVSTQTELHRVENVTVTNRTTKTLDNSYEQMTQHGVPTVRTYFAPPNRERISTSPQPAKPYTPTFTLERKQPERRHSLLLDRLSTERQVAPPESYQNTYNYQSNQSYETVTSNQWGQEPHSEVVIASNVKPSSISNSQWYQAPQPQPQQQPSSNVIYNTVKPTTPTPNAQPSWQKPSYDSAPYSAPAYQPEPQGYVPQPSTWGSNNLTNLDRLPSVNAQSNQYSFMSNKSTSESYSQKTTGSPQYSTGYVPPPWESDPNAPYQSAPSPYYQPQSTTPATTPTAQPSWAPNPQPPKFTKPSPLSYQPPKPNQSFVKKATPGPISEPGRKTYYSEYERRYISVPESTYIPTETKAQPQWDPSPQYYYDNPEPTEEIEQPWRKELREFTEKSTKVDETTVIQPPWTEEAKYPKSTEFSPQPTWSQTMRPRSWRERSYDESVQQQSSQEWPRASTLNRRPVSAFVKTRLDSPSYERARGVSVDRYNVNSYQAPASYAPASNNSYTLPWEIQEQPSQAPQQYNEVVQQSAPQQSSYHNPQVPAYHVRPTESRDYQVSYQPRWSGMGRDCPVQSRSFKYLQMLTGTEDGVEQPEPFVVQQPHHSQPRPRRV